MSDDKLTPLVPDVPAECPHGNGARETCSQCLGAPARVVTSDGGQLSIDGAPAGRGVDPIVNTHGYGRSYRRKK